MILRHKEVGEANAAIFEMQQTILEEQTLVDRVNSIIVEEKLNAEYAVQTTTEVSSNDGDREKIILQGHGADVKDVALGFCRSSPEAGKTRLLTDEPFVMAAGELYPSEAVQLDKSKGIRFCNHDTVRSIPIQQ